VVALVLLGGANGAWAQSYYGNTYGQQFGYHRSYTRGQQAILAPGLTLGVEGGYYRYSENPQFMDLTSNKAIGASLAYQVVSSQGISWRVEGRYLNAPADYASSQGKAADEPNMLADGRFLLTHEVDMSGSSLAAYIGLGYRYLQNDGKDVNGYAGYTRTSQYLYAPVGVWGGVAAGPNSMWVGQAEVGQLIAGRQYSDINGGLYNNQHNGREIRLYGAYRYGGLELGPYAQFWQIDESDSACAGGLCGVEPKNFTREIGLRLSYHF
jgi:hypothetical protein